MNWGGYLRAALRGLVQAVPVVGPMVAECAKHADEERFQAHVEALALRVARGERGRTQGLLRLTEDEVEQAVANGVRPCRSPIETTLSHRSRNRRRGRLPISCATR